MRCLCLLVAAAALLTGCTDEETYRLACFAQDGIPVKHPQTGQYTCLIRGNSGGH